MATTQELINYYADLLIQQYKQKPNAYATVQAFVKPVIMDQLPLLVQDAYDLSSSVGVQLDVLGKYAGVTRNGYDFSGAVVLSDADFREFIKLAIFQNSAGSSLADIQNLISIFFSNILFVFDYGGMRIGYFLDSDSIGNQLAEVFIQSGLLPKPMGVQLSALVYATSIDNWYGWSSYDTPAFNVHGFNTYSQYDLNCHWLDDNDVIGV